MQLSILYMVTSRLMAFLCLGLGGLWLEAVKAITELS
jgi:hypothetical protein